MISKLPGGNLEVKARRRLATPAAFEAFVEEMQSTLIQLKELDSNASVNDFDVSQNPLTSEQFEMLFNALALAGVKVQRFRLFGCPALNDEAMRHLSDHFTQDLTAETAPSELHLSDCAITTDGFLLLMNAIEDKELYPCGPMPGRRLPLYLRLENNYIDEAVIQEKVDAGFIRAFKKAPGVRMEAPETVKINLVVKQDNSFQQKEGPPPAPEDAPPPKDVYDQKPQQSNWRQGPIRPAWNAGGRYQPAPRGAVRPQWAARPALAGPAPMMARPAYGGMQPGVVRPVLQAVRPGQFQPRAIIQAARPAWQGAVIQGKGSSWPRGTAGTQQAVDRSRTPVNRSFNANSSGPFPPSGPPPKKTNDLPHPWEEQWSDEYGIPYYWNSETGEALWEKPTA